MRVWLNLHKMNSSLEPGDAEQTHPVKNEPVRHVSRVVAHELNNLFTIIQGYSERLLLKHGGDPTMEEHLKRIFEASRRAAEIVRAATPPAANIQQPKENLQPSKLPPA